MATRNLRRFVSVILVLGLAGSVWGEVKVNPIFADGMVLQRGMKVPVYGTADKGEKVTVQFAGQSKTATAGDDGKWMVKLDELKASSDSAKMKVCDKVIENVLVGEVWVCSGQSNMAFGMRADKETPQEAPNANFPNIRWQNRLQWKGPIWAPITPKNVTRVFAVAYYFAKTLHKELKVPIGLIGRARGGTPIEAWMLPDTADDVFKKIDPNGKRSAKGRNGNLWTVHIAPLVPYGIRGVIWYQGERNAKEGTGWHYRYLQKRQVEDWRKAWGQGEFPFLWVQVPTGANGGGMAQLRDSERRALALTPNTGMAVFYDYGPSLHPPKKRAAGQRLALWALGTTYGKKDLVYSGPLLRDKDIKVPGKTLILSFDHVGGGLLAKGGGKELKYFEICGADGKWTPAKAVIEGKTVMVSSDSVARPLHARYLWSTGGKPVVSLLNKEGLPASPFVTDPNFGKPK
ncbi:MAG: sialate O-acetylesterase [Phycisphaerae bacterium]|jgi:sialate O-acetylesterase|nr:sialate O-acetylesterase [Phycisphaerae bacterium]